MKYIFAFVLCGVGLSAGSVGTVGCEEHPNYTVQIPCNSLSNLSGVILEAIAQEFPQNRFVFSDRWVGYLDSVLPAIPIIWTTPSLGPFIFKDEPERIYGSPVPPPIVPPPVVPHPPCVGCTPVVCYHDCHQAPPVISEVPEPDIRILFLVGLIAIFYLRQSRCYLR